MWIFTENPWPLIVLLACGAVALGIQWSQTRRFPFFLGMNALILLMAGSYALAQAIVTDREQLQASVVDIVHQFQQNHRDETLNYISDSPQAATLKALAAAAIDRVDLGPDVHVTDVQVDLKLEGTRGSTHFRVNGTMTLKGHGNVGHHPLRFRATWQKEPDAKTGKPMWKMLQIEDLDPITGNPLNRFNQVQVGA